MPNLLESMSMCMWFDVNAISRRNLLSTLVSSILVITFPGESSLYLSLLIRLIFFSSLWHGGLWLASHRQLRKVKRQISLTTFAAFWDLFRLSWLILFRMSNLMELDMREESVEAAALRFGYLLALYLDLHPSSLAYGWWSQSSQTRWKQRKASALCFKTFSFSSHH